MHKSDTYEENLQEVYSGLKNLENGAVVNQKNNYEDVASLYKY